MTANHQSAIPLYYQIEQDLGSGGSTILHVRVIVAPALIRSGIKPVLRANATVALLCGSSLWALHAALRAAPTPEDG